MSHQQQLPYEQQTFYQQNQQYDEQQQQLILQQQQQQQQINIIQQQTSSPQRVGGLLKNPTNYHIKQVEIRNKNIGAPPTPNNSFNNNSTIDNSTIDTGIDPIPDSNLIHQYSAFNINNAGTIKQETGSPDTHQVDMELNTMSPLSNSPTYGSDTEEFGRSYKPSSHLAHFPSQLGLETLDTLDTLEQLESQSPFEESPHNRINIHTIGNMSMSLPVNNTSDTWYSNSFDQSYQQNAQRSNLLYSTTSPEAGYLASGAFLGSGGNENAKTAMLNEKRRRRRESHNAVERRRRDNINEQIQELSRLLPEMFMESSNKPNKGLILRKSVDYIKFLKQKLDRLDFQQNQLNVQTKQSDAGDTSLFSIVGEDVSNNNSNNNNNNSNNNNDNNNNNDDDN